MVEYLNLLDFIQIMETAIFTLLGAVVGGLISWLLQKQQFAHQLKLAQEANKTEFMAERTARHYLDHKGYTDRSFEVIRDHLGGFDDDEVRRILVRAGAIKVKGDDGKEKWRLLERSPEYIEKKIAKEKAKKKNA